MSGHTPGPWECFAFSPDAWHVTPADALLAPVAVVELWPREGEMEANARLIAAAPELADALEGLLINTETGSYCEWCRQHAPKDEAGQLVGPVPHAGGCPAVIAHAALAKAGRGCVR